MFIGLLDGCQRRLTQDAWLLHRRFKDLPRDVHRQNIGEPQEISTGKVTF